MTSNEVYELLRVAEQRHWRLTMQREPLHPDPSARLAELSAAPEIAGLRRVHYTIAPRTSIGDPLDVGNLAERACNGYGSGTVAPFVVEKVSGTAKRPASKATLLPLLLWDEEQAVGFVDPTKPYEIRLSTGNDPVWVDAGHSGAARHRIYDIVPARAPRRDYGFDK
jgi:hypothetical protein